MTGNPRALLVATSVSDSGMRMARALEAVGFEVAAHCPAFHLFTQVSGLRVFKTNFRCLSSVRALCHSLHHWRPDVLVPCDDAAVHLFHDIYREAPQWATLIERSLGEPETFAVVGTRINFLSVMKEAEGVSVPEWTVIHSSDDIPTNLHSYDFPLVLKREGSSGGGGVRIVRNREMAIAAYENLRTRPSFLGRTREVIENAAFGVLRGSSENDQEIMVQRYIHGQPANRAVVCWKGEVLAGISMAVLQSSRETTPATVVEHIEHPEMDRAACAAVKLLGLSGFCGFDFMLEHGSQRAWLMEMNPRVTPTAHLPLGDGHDLAAAFLSICASQPVSARRPLAMNTIALFPKEFLRDAASPYFQSAYHDVPWDDSKLVSACIRRNAHTDFYGRLRSVFLGARKCVPDSLLRPIYSVQPGNRALFEGQQDRQTT